MDDSNLIGNVRSEINDAIAELQNGEVDAAYARYVKIIKNPRVNQQKAALDICVGALNQFNGPQYLIVSSFVKLIPKLDCMYIYKFMLESLLRTKHFSEKTDNVVRFINFFPDHCEGQEEMRSVNAPSIEGEIAIMTNIVNHLSRSDRANLIRVNTLFHKVVLPAAIQEEIRSAVRLSKVFADPQFKCLFEAFSLQVNTCTNLNRLNILVTSLEDKIMSRLVLTRSRFDHLSEDCVMHNKIIRVYNSITNVRARYILDTLTQSNYDESLLKILMVDVCVKASDTDTTQFFSNCIDASIEQNTLMSLRTALYLVKGLHKMTFKMGGDAPVLERNNVIFDAYDKIISAYVSKNQWMEVAKVAREYPKQTLIFKDNIPVGGTNKYKRMDLALKLLYAAAEKDPTYNKIADDYKKEFITVVRNIFSNKDKLLILSSLGFYDEAIDVFANFSEHEFIEYGQTVLREFNSSTFATTPESRHNFVTYRDRICSIFINYVKTRSDNQFAYIFDLRLDGGVNNLKPLLLQMLKDSILNSEEISENAHLIPMIERQLKLMVSEESK